MDTRREVRQIWKHFDRHHETIGESLIYYRFDADTSAYDKVYDEGFRRYHMGKPIPILWVDQQEATEDYGPEGRRPTQRLRCAVSAKNMYEAGFSVTEVHGNRIYDISPSEIWKRDRMHDLCYYDGRYWEISGYQIRGRAKGEDVIIGITAVETFPDDDMNFDYEPGTVPIVPVEPIPFVINVMPNTDNPYDYSFTVSDDPDHHVDWDYGDGTTEEDVLCAEVVDHTYDEAGHYTVTAYCHRETITTEVEVAPGPGYGMGQYGIVQPYGGYASE